MKQGRNILHSIAIAVLISFASVDAAQVTLIPIGSTWRYLDDGTDQGTAWRRPDFDDSSWSEGAAELGYGDGGESTVISYGSDPNNKFITYYFRKSFVSATTLTNLYLKMVCDDGAVVYLNGQEVYRYNMPGTSIGQQTEAIKDINGTGETVFFLSRALPAGLVSLGTNVLAVEVHQYTNNSADLSFNLMLLGDMPPPNLQYPLISGQRGIVNCLESPDITYDIFLPPGYSPIGAPMPILYTMHPNGGGMVGNFQGIAGTMKIIVVGILGSANGVSEDMILREYEAVSRDIRLRVTFDPTAEFASGFSGGGQVSYWYSRFRPQHVAGVFAMAGWLGVYNGQPYESVNRVQTNLLVSRATGNSDTAAIFYLAPDSNYLASCGAVIQDLMFSGGHVIPADSVKTTCLNWLLTNRVAAGVSDRTNAVIKANDWKARVAAGDRESVLRECVNSLMTHPRTWEGYQAQLVLDDLEKDYSIFRRINVANLASGDFAVDHFYHGGRAAAYAANFSVYHASMKALTGITGSSGDHASAINVLSSIYGYPAPILQCLPATNPGSIELKVEKDAPGLHYFPESRTDLLSGTWQPMAGSATDTNTIWSVQAATTNADLGFFRVRTTPPVP